MGLTGVLFEDSGPSGLPEILAVAHVIEGGGPLESLGFVMSFLSLITRPL